jgi:hypothetical protein
MSTADEAVGGKDGGVWVTFKWFNITHALSLGRDGAAAEGGAPSSALKDPTEGGDFGPEYDQQACAAVKGTLNLHWTQVYGSWQGCTAIETVGPHDTFEKRAGIKSSDLHCTSTDSYTVDTGWKLPSSSQELSKSTGSPASLLATMDTRTGVRMVLRR